MWGFLPWIVDALTPGPKPRSFPLSDTKSRFERLCRRILLEWFDGYVDCVVDIERQQLVTEYYGWIYRIDLPFSVITPGNGESVEKWVKRLREHLIREILNAH